MKRYIQCASKRDLSRTIEIGFMNAKCRSAKVTDFHDDHCTVELVLPSGKGPISITVWYDTTKTKNGKQSSAKYIPYDPTYTMNSSGDVFDSSGNYIGQAAVKTSGPSVQKYKTSYLKRSIRTDSGDVIIDHPELSKTYQDVVKTLETRKINRRS